MAENKKLIDLDLLKIYDGKIKGKISADDAATLKSAKDYADGLATNYDAAGTGASEALKVKNELEPKITTNTDAITKLNADKETVGSIDYKVDQAVSPVKTIADANKAAIDIINGTETVEGSIKKAVADLKKEISKSAYDDTQVKKDIKANADAIGVLNGTGEGSISKAVSDAVASIVADAPAAYDTLKEIADWIANHPEDTTAMNTAIQKNTGDIANLANLVGTLPEGVASTTVVDYINEKVGAVDFTEAIATAKQEAITAAATSAASTFNPKITANTTAINSLKDGQVKTNTDAIAALQTAIGNVATEEDINNLFK